ncbi:(Fe-S)-binding protein [Nautilia lithotrophica]
MKIALHVPCYINELFPNVAKATTLLLRNLGYNVTIPKNQTCCGQPFINSGYDTTLPNMYDEIFGEFDYIVSPSSSCVSTIKSQNLNISYKSYELIDFLHSQNHLNLAKNHKPLILHNSCHSMRHIDIATPSELNIPYINKVKEVLGCEIIEAKRDECCGFGGVFSVKEGEMSYIIGKEKLNDLLSGWQYDFTPVITGVDMSCLMHLKGIAEKEGINAEFKHVSEILLESLDETL